MRLLSVIALCLSGVGFGSGARSVTAQAVAIDSLIARAEWPADIRVVDATGDFPPEDLARLEACVRETLGDAARRHGARGIREASGEAHFYLEALMVPSESGVPVNISLAVGRPSGGREVVLEAGGAQEAFGNTTDEACAAVHDAIFELVDELVLGTMR